MSEYTPGPWYDDWDDSEPGEVRAVRSSDRLVCSFVASEPDARLIAAAPEMHEILAEMREWAEVGGNLSMYASFDEERTFGEVILSVLARVEGT